MGVILLQDQIFLEDPVNGANTLFESQYLSTTQYGVTFQIT